MSALTASIASSWSAVSRNGNERSSRSCHSPSGEKLMPAAGLALRVEVDELAGAVSRAERRAFAFICAPALAAELRELGVLAAAHVAGDLGELLGRDEDLVAVAVLELEVVAGDPGDRAGVEAGEAGDAVVLVDDVLAGGQVAERGEPAAGRRRSGGAAAMDEAAEGDDRELQRRRDEAVGDPAPRRTEPRGRPEAGRRRASSASAARARSGPARPRRSARRRRRSCSPSESASRARARPRARLRAADTGIDARKAPTPFGGIGLAVGDPVMHSEARARSGSRTAT